ncbi:hypothetical protein DFQ13_105536 [Actinokineospora spheciospongiae]|nr:hypothetical protein DFQ13_105536 [Actinokineospora spheciospongiae]
MLIRMGSIAKAFQTEEVSVVMGQPYAPNLEDERRRMNAERALCEHARKHY